MLRDDAIRQGLLKPTKEDIERMNLTKDDLVKLGFEKEGKPKKTATKKGK